MSKRELIEPNEGDKRYARRDDEGRFSEQDDLGRSHAQDVRKDAEHDTEPGHGDRGDREG